jgi:hypothetical protein
MPPRPVMGIALRVLFLYSQGIDRVNVELETKISEMWRVNIRVRRR